MIPSVFITFERVSAVIDSHASTIECLTGSGDTASAISLLHLSMSSLIEQARSVLD